MRKIVRVFDAELRAKQNESREVEGYAVVFNQSTDLGWFTEEIDRNAFNTTDMSSVYLLFNHDENNVLAGTANGSLNMTIDERGLFQVSDLIDTTTGEDVLKLVKNGLINKMSFAFTIADGGEEWSERDGKEHRIIRNIDRLYDLSLVTYPAYDQTSAYSRSLIDESAEKHRRRKMQDKRMERILTHGKSNE